MPIFAPPPSPPLRPPRPHFIQKFLSNKKNYLKKIIIALHWPGWENRSLTSYLSKWRDLTKIRSKERFHLSEKKKKINVSGFWMRIKKNRLLINFLSNHWLNKYALPFRWVFSRVLLCHNFSNLNAFTKY